MKKEYGVFIIITYDSEEEKEKAKKQIDEWVKEEFKNWMMGELTITENENKIKASVIFS